jgi:hypothetical protein
LAHFTRAGEQKEINEIFHATVGRASRQRVGVQLFGNLLLFGDETHFSRGYFRKAEPVLASNLLQRLDQYITNATSKWNRDNVLQSMRHSMG